MNQHNGTRGRLLTPIRQFWPLLQRYPRVAAGYAPDTMLTPGQLLDLVQRLEGAHGRTDLAFECGCAANPLDSYGTVAFIGLSCRTREDLYHYVVRQFDAVSEMFAGDYWRGTDAGVLRLAPRAPMAPELLRFLTEYIAVAGVRAMALMVQDAQSIAEDYWLAIPPPPHAARYAELAPASFHFDAAQPGLTVVTPLEMLHRELPMAAPRVVERYEAEQQALREAASTLGLRVRRLLHVHGKPPTIDDVARSLGMSPRSLDRNLDREGLNFRDMAREILIERARVMLAEPGATVTQVSRQLGFSDAANFTRSFRRATGTTPRDLRV